jgi:uncharacterized protein (TIGR03663 family)
MAWFTVEILLYGLIIIVALTLRLWRLGAYPLSDVEAQQALAAWQIYQGGTPEPVGYSPLLVSFNTLTFFLVHESEFTARLASALLGTALVVLPLTLRRRLGRPVSLLTAIILALSPTALYLSRTVNSEIVVATGALMIVSGFFNWLEDGRRQWLYLLAGGLALLLSAGPMAYTIIVIFSLVILIKWADFKAAWRLGRSHASSGPNSHNAPQEISLSSYLRPVAIFFLVLLFLLSTAATFNLSGFGVTTNLFVEWLRRFGSQPNPDAGFNAVFLLTMYEPLLVMAGLVGLAYALLSRDLLRQALVGWFLGILLVDLVIAGRPNGSVILALVPLAFLAALALAELWTGLQREGSWQNEGLILGSGLVIAVFGYIGLTGWLTRPCGTDDTFCQLAWLQAVAALLLFLIIVIFFWFTTSNGGLALRGLALTGTAVGLVVMVNIAWRLNYGPLMTLAYQPLAGIPASTELVQLKETLARESFVRGKDRNLLDVTVLNSRHPALDWQLRDFRNLTFVNSLGEALPTTVIITPVEGNEALPLDGAYIGQDFKVNAVWSPVGIQPHELMSWFIYRELPATPEGDRVILWLRV